MMKRTKNVQGQQKDRRKQTAGRKRDCEQATVNPNMPFRFLQYVTGEYSRLVGDLDFYGNALVKLPTPHFVVFYNGLRMQPERQVLRLSDAFQVKECDP